MVRKTKTVADIGKQPSATKYPKSEILKSDEFTKVEQDFLSAFLSDDSHTIEEAKDLLTKIRKGAVK